MGGDVMLGTGQMGGDVMLGSRCVDRTAGVGVDHVEVLYGFLGTTGQLGVMLGSRQTCTLGYTMRSKPPIE